MNTSAIQCACSMPTAAKKVQCGRIRSNGQPSPGRRPRRSFPTRGKNDSTRQRRGNPWYTKTRAVELSSGGGDGKGGDGKGGAGGGGGGWDAGDEGSENRPSGFNPLALFLAGFKARTAADPNFPFKICLELLNDLTIILTVNFLARGERFFKEIQFVLCQAAVSLLNDTTLVYLLAPTGAKTVSQATGLKGYIASLPANLFESGSYSIAQRIGCVLYKGCIYSCIGLVMGLLGTQLVHTLTDLQERMDPAFEAPTEMQPVLKSGFAWMGFMGVNSNLRYQTVNGLERVVYAMAGDKVGLARAGSLLVRLGNNFLGSMTWIWWSSFLKLNEPRESKRQPK